MMPTPHSVGVKRLQQAGSDAHGEPTTTYSDPVALLVYFVAPAASVEPQRANRDLLSTDLVVGAPRSRFLPGPRDIVVWRGQEYTVEGAIEDYSYGPFGYTPGVSFLIRRVEG